MSEYTNVEKPFLEKLRQLHWRVIDQGKGVPQEPQKSLRDNFEQVMLCGEFKHAVKSINLTDDGREWLTEKQLDEILLEIQNYTGKRLHEANKDIHRMLLKGTTVNKNELTGELSPTVRLVDFKNWEKNKFIAINQFRLLTPGASRKGIIPDIVLFLNGMPIVVVECKDLDVAEPLSNAYEQVTRYANTRDDDYGVKEGQEKLFHYNLFNIITHGKEARVGTISAEFEFYNNWVDIFPEEYKVVEFPPDEERQEVMIHGMLNKEILIDILKHFTIFMEIKRGVEVKIVARYNQYRAVGKIIRNFRNGHTPMERGGVIWHTQGSGKSLTMVFLIRKLRSCSDLKDLKIVFIVDRIDLEEQLSETAELTGEPVRIIDRRNKLHLLADDTGDVNMVMIHKFLAENNVSAQSLIDAGIVPKFERFEVINSSDRIMLLVDEAHRTQGGDMGDNLFAAFDNAARIGFTGTPLITDRHEIKTHERFGSYIDTYKFDTAVKDRATVEIKYIGKVSKDKLDDKEQFDLEFEDMFKQRTTAEREEIQRRYGTFTAYLESLPRIKAIAKDIIEHYYNEIHVNGFKAQVVASSIIAAVRYKYELEKAIQNKITELKALPDEQRDDERIRQLGFLKVAAIVSSMGNNEPGYISTARQEALDWDAKNNFKTDFDYSVEEGGQYRKPETGIGIICVCDRLLTGYDAPVEQVMYLDKNLKEHDLFQAIARVNRTKKGKSFGLIVDYYGVTKHLSEALAIFTDSDKDKLQKLLEVFRDINKEIPVLEARYNRILNMFKDADLNSIGEFLSQTMTDGAKEFDFAEECIEKAESIKFRAELLTYAKSFFASLDLLFNSKAGTDYWVQAKRLGYLLWRIKNRYKDETMDLKWASEKVRKLIDRHLLSLGIDSKVKQVSILSDEFKHKVDTLNKTLKSKASEMEHAIRWHIKVNLDKDPAFYNRFKDRLERILNTYKENWEAIVTEMETMREEIAKGREPETEGISKNEAPFYDILKKEIAEENEKYIELTKALTHKLIILLQKTASIPNFWSERKAEQRTITGEIEDEIRYSRIKGFYEKSTELANELMQIAKNREADLR